MSRLLHGAALAALTMGVCVAAGAAQAQSYNRLVVFGDSLSDNGNLYAATGGAQPPAPIYTDGRFSTGPVFVERLGFDLARVGGPVTGSINYAYGGARTDSAMSPPGMRTQLMMYMGAGGTFGANDLVSILGGANNIFQALPTAGMSSNPTGAIAPVALAAAADINFLVDSVAGAGAGTILVTNLPKLSLTPQFRTSPAAPLADFAVSNFNSALSTGLFATAAARPNSNIILMDLFKVGDAIAANPQAFGIQNITQPCFNGVSLCSNPQDYFYLDGVHPTAAGHAIIARLANDYLYYGDAGAETALQGETGYRHRMDGLDTASDRLSGRADWTSGTAISVGALFDHAETGARGFVGESDANSWGTRLALESGTNNLRFGASGSFTQAEVTSDELAFDVESLAVDVYGGWRSADGMFLTGVVGMARDNYDTIERLTALAPITHTAETTGSSFGAKLQGGVWFDMGGIGLSPRVAVSWVSSDVDGYVERGSAATYEFSDRTVETMNGEVALRAEGGMGGGFDFYVEGGYRDTLDENSDAVGTRISGSPSHMLFREIDDPIGGQMMANAGINGMIGERLRLNIGYRGRFGDATDSHMGGISLTLPL